MKKKPRVLVVDDEVSMQELLETALRLSGFEVLLAGNVQEFRQKAFSEKPDIIILDIMLGADDGTEAYHQLLNDGLNCEIPVVFLSALAGDRPPAYTQGDHRFALIGKPFDPALLIQQLERMLHK